MGNIPLVSCARGETRERGRDAMGVSNRITARSVLEEQEDLMPRRTWIVFLLLVLIGVAYGDFGLDRIVIVGFAGLIAALTVIAWLLSSRLDRIKWILESIRLRLYNMR